MRWGVVGIADPHGRYHMRRVTYGPAIAHIVGRRTGCAGFDCHPMTGNLQAIVLAELFQAGIVVGQNVAEQVGVFRAYYLSVGGDTAVCS